MRTIINNISFDDIESLRRGGVQAHQLLKSCWKQPKKYKVKVGICGQGPSDFPDFAQFLVDQGIDSISMTPDSLVKTVKAISAVEKK